MCRPDISCLCVQEELRVALWDLETKHVRYILDEYGTQINLADEVGDRLTSMV